MNDQTPADVTPEDMEHARAYVQDFLDATHGPDRTLAVARVLQALLPPPPRPTLADMTEEERAECQWMQCDVTGFQGQLVLATTCDDDDEAGLVADCGEVVWSSLAQVTPRPDLRRWEWPGTEKPAPAPALPEGWRLADHREYGRVIVTRPEPDCDGEFVIIRPHPHRVPRMDTVWCDPDELTYIDGPESPAPVPPNTLAEGSVWDDGDALARACRESGRDQIVALDSFGDAYVWAYDDEGWEDSHTLAVGSAWTVLHIGKKADQ